MGFIKEKYIDSWEQLKRIISDDFTSQRLRKHWIFRGQNNYKWSLLTAIERLNLFVEESEIIEDFERHAHLYTDTRKIDSKLEWLSLMQHHGAPTRLLDWTFSPYIAIFFALNEVEIDIHSTERQYCALYAFNYYPISKKLSKDDTYKHLFQDNFLYKNIVSKTMPELENAFLSGGFNDSIPRTILPLIPFNSHTRLRIQQGLFLCPTHFPFEDTLLSTLKDIDYPIENIIRKYLIPVELKPQIIIELNHMNINDATLFPDIEGYSRFLKKNYSLGNEEDKANVIKQKLR